MSTFNFSARGYMARSSVVVRQQNLSVSENEIFVNIMLKYVYKCVKVIYVYLKDICFTDSLMNFSPQFF